MTSTQIPINSPELRLLEGLESSVPRTRDVSIKWLADHDDFYRFKYIYGFNLLDDNTHREFVEYTSNSKTSRAARFWPRLTYKTTIGVIGGCIEELRKNPDMAILVAMNSGTNAARSLSEIKSVLNHPRFIKYYGSWLHGSPRDQQYSLIINRRKRAQKSGSIDVIGKDSRSTSQHYDLIIYDDIVDENDRDSLAEREDTIRFFTDTVDLLNPGGRIRMYGTFWHHEDCYQHLIDKVNPLLNEEFAKGNRESQPYDIIITPAIDDDGNLNFPAVLSQERLDRLRVEKGIHSYMAQQMLKPLSETATTFLRDNCHFFDFDIYQENLGEYDIYGACDPALGKSDGGCYTAIGSVLINEIGEMCIFDADMGIRRPSELVDCIIEKDAVFFYRDFGLESNAAQSLYGDLLDAKIKEINLRIHLERLKRQEVGAGSEPERTVRFVPYTPINNTENKDSRIKMSEGPYTAGHIKFRRDWRTAPNNYQEFCKQVWNYPQSTYKDGPDMLQMLYRIAFGGSINVAVRA